MQPGPLQPHQIAPAQSGVESHQDEIAQPGRGGRDQSRCFVRGEKALMGVAEYVKMISLVPIEYTELLASADHKYRRFAFIGRVIYDDFFGNRHTRRFCVKTRLMDKGLFQLIRGGRAYNHVDRQKIPEDE
jgi:hypothetical protein